MSSKRTGECDYCFTPITKLISHKDEAYEKIKELLNGLVNIYQVETKEMGGEGNLLRIELVEFWHIFNIEVLDYKRIHNILVDMLHERYEQQPKLFNTSVVIRAFQNAEFRQNQSIFGKGSYADFVATLQTKQRFHIDRFNDEVFGIIMEFATLSIAADEVFYRARLCEGGKAREIKQMGAPPTIECATGAGEFKGH